MKSCELHDCNASLGWKTNGQAASQPADSDATCCLPTCRRYSCSHGWVANPKASDKARVCKGFMNEARLLDMQVAIASTRNLSAALPARRVAAMKSVV